jgi:hypothetical protein
MGRAVLACVVAVLLAPATAFAATFYVDSATGLDANDCATPATPCGTLTGALA